LLVDSVESMMMHGLANPKSQIYFILEQHSTCFRWSLHPSSGV